MKTKTTDQIMHTATLPYIIRQEQPIDFSQTEELIERAFRPLEESDHREHLLVGRLRRCDSFIPELSLVAATDSGTILGHILMSKVRIVGEDGSEAEVLALAPLSVAPELQHCGIGSTLMREAHAIAEKNGYALSVVLGHPAYYPSFGYVTASSCGIKFPFDAPEECCMVRELVPGALNSITGIVLYPTVFFE